MLQCMMEWSHWRVKAFVGEGTRLDSPAGGEEKRGLTGLRWTSDICGVGGRRAMRSK